MALPADYITGTITLTNASNAFTGTGTGWQAADFREGDIILGIQDNAGVVYVVSSITSNTAGTLTQPWAGPTGTYTYRMRYEWDSSRVSAQTRTLIELLGNGNLQAIAGIDGTGGDKGILLTGTGTAATYPLTPAARAMLALDGVADKIPYLTGASTAELADLSPYMRGLLGETSQTLLRSAITPGEHGIFTPPDFATADLAPDEVGSMIGGEGWYFLASSAASAIQFPPGFPQTYGVISGYSNPNNNFRYSWQKLTGPIGNREWMRRASATTTWGPWNEVYHTGNVVGTVAQSSGLPVGAIVERGSNGNGEYVRLADGTQICWLHRTVAQDVTAVYGPLFSGTYAWTFPATFASEPSVDCGRFTWGNQAGWGAVSSGVSVGGATLVIYDVASRPIDNGYVSATAIGRWF